jgi:sulfate adenylyltransferase
VTVEAQAQHAADHATLPSLTLDARQLGDLELILSGAFAPLGGFMTWADVAAVADKATLAGGTPWPVPVTLQVPADAITADARQALLADPEGTPLAVLTITERTPLPATASSGATSSGATSSGATSSDAVDRIMLAGPVRAHRAPEHGSFRRLMIPPGQARADFGGGAVLAFATRAPISARQIGQLKHLAGQLKARLLLLALVAGPAEVVRQPEALVRSVLAAARNLPAGTLVVPVPYAHRTGPPNRGSPADSGGRGRQRELATTAIIAAAYGATHLMADGWPGLARASGEETAAQSVPPDSPTRLTRAPTGPPEETTRLPGAPIPVLPSGEWAYDPSAEVWRPLSLIEPGREIEDLTPDQLADMLDTGAEIPSWFASESVVAELRHARPPRSRRGFVVFLTGLSGSGKSTIATALRDKLAERGDRKVSLLDGDLVRSLLSAGLTFSRADRDLNIARIGYVAAEIAKHGGIAICAPIAPYAAARERVRRMVSDVGDFLLIYVATPVEVCERRDRKGLYAKARAGLIKQFTGVSDPYEEPEDAALVFDTSVVSCEQATETIMAMLTSGGWLAADEGPREA